MRKTRIICFLLLTVVLLGFVLGGCSQTKRIYGSWTYDQDTTIYKFNKDGTGAVYFMHVPAKFTWKLEGNFLTVDFGLGDDDSIEDGVISFYGDSEFVFESPKDSGNYRTFVKTADP